MKKLRKKTLLWVLIPLLVLALGAGLWLVLASGGDPVPVYSFSMVGMTEFWGDKQESYGPVSTDRIQTVFLSDTQTITEVKVALGDQVKKGDVLMTFDTTLSDLKLEKQRLAVEKLKLKIEEEKKELKRIQHLEPMEETDFASPAPGPGDPGEELALRFIVYPTPEHTGLSPETAALCWIREEETFSDPQLLQAIREDLEWFLKEAAQEAAPEDAPAQAAEANPYYVVFKTTQDNMSKTPTVTWQGIRAEWTGSEFHLRFFSPSIGDYTQEPEDLGGSYLPDFGSGYTAQEILQMAVEQAKVIQDLDFQLKMEEAEYKIMLKELGDGNIYSEFDGEVVSLLTEEEARDGKQPMLKVSGGGGFTIEGTVSELVMEKLTLGQEVEVNDWNTGGICTGTIQSIGDFPENGNGWNGMGNPNASYYPFRVFVDGEANLQSGSYVSIQYSAGEASSGVYLENPFLRTGPEGSYVYVRDARGNLEKRNVTTGRSLWGSYTEILSGLTVDDFIAFPYGKELREGAKTTEGDLASLYGY